jgi:hypothetical protein
VERDEVHAGVVAIDVELVDHRLDVDRLGLERIATGVRDADEAEQDQRLSHRVPVKP